MGKSKRSVGRGGKNTAKSGSNWRLAAVLLAVIAIAGLGAVLYIHQRSDRGMERKIWSAYKEGAKYGEIAVTYPYGGTVFPPDIIAPLFQWKDNLAACDMWLVTLEFPDGALRYLSRETKWKPERAAAR